MKAKKTAQSQKSAKTKVKTKRKYVESHWLVFVCKGIIALLAGAYIVFSGTHDAPHLVLVVGSVLIGLSIIEILNVFHRRRMQHNWGISLAVAIFEAGIGIALVSTNQEILSGQEGFALHIALLASYTIIRGVTSIAIGFTGFSNMTDRFLWITCGMVSTVIGFVILAHPDLSQPTFVKIFGTFLMVLGLTDTFFGIHSRDETRQLKEAKKSKK